MRCRVKRKHGDKPVISRDSATRLRQAAKLIADAAKRAKRLYGVDLSIQDDAFVFRDSLRKDDWDGYGDIDAWMFDAAMGMSMSRFHLEDFSGWDK